jgi:hypothetical protein
MVPHACSRRENRADDRGDPVLIRSQMVRPGAQEAMAITMEPLPLSPRGGVGAVMP